MQQRQMVHCLLSFGVFLCLDDERLQSLCGAAVCHWGLLVSLETHEVMMHVLDFCTFTSIYCKLCQSSKEAGRVWSAEPQVEFLCVCLAPFPDWLIHTNVFLCNPACYSQTHCGRSRGHVCGCWCIWSWVQRSDGACSCTMRNWSLNTWSPDLEQHSRGFREQEGTRGADLWTWSHEACDVSMQLVDVDRLSSGARESALSLSAHSSGGGTNLFMFPSAS